MVSGEATNTNFIIFDVTRPVLEFTRCTSLEANTLTIVPAVQFEDNYGIKSHKLKKNRQYNDQKKKDKKRKHLSTRKLKIEHHEPH
jgi:hypothetical protein